MRLDVLGYVYTIPDRFSCRHEKHFGIVWTETAQNWNKSFTQANGCTEATCFSTDNGIRILVACPSKLGLRSSYNFRNVSRFIRKFSFHSSAVTLWVIKLSHHSLHLPGLTQNNLARGNVLPFVLSLKSLSISKSWSRFLRLFRWFKAVKFMIQSCKLSTAFEIAEINTSGKAAILWNPILPPSYWLPLRSGTCSHDAKEWYENLSDTWRFTFKMQAAQRRSIAKTAPKSASYVWTKALSDMVFVTAQELSGIV